VNNAAAGKLEIILIAGPNGTGKTTFANALRASGRAIAYLNADEIARGYSDLPLSQRSVKAGRAMLLAIDGLVTSRQNVMIETTLAGLTYIKKIEAWRDIGYYVGVIYLRPPSADIVVKRVAAGGHNVPEDDIRRRFDRSWHNLHNHYMPIVDDWSIWEADDDGGYKSVGTSEDE